MAAGVLIFPSRTLLTVKLLIGASKTVDTVKSDFWMGPGQEPWRGAGAEPRGENFGGFAAKIMVFVALKSRVILCF